MGSERRWLRLREPLRTRSHCEQLQKVPLPQQFAPFRNSLAAADVAVDERVTSNLKKERIIRAVQPRTFRRRDFKLVNFIKIRVAETRSALSD